MTFDVVLKALDDSVEPSVVGAGDPVTGLASDDGDGGQSLSVPAKRLAHGEHSRAGVTVNEQIPGKPQRAEEAFVGEHPSRL